MLLRLRE
ncbi:hypothetical protein D041_4028A, partial [Vibrio parahaemolyticus EKP-008]